MDIQDKRLIEHGFPCHQVGAETQRERGASSALPPLYFLHVWWARRPLTPSRAAIVASLAGDAMDPDLFIRQLGIERIQAMVNGVSWTLTGDITNWIKGDGSRGEYLPVDQKALRSLDAEEKRRAENRDLISGIKTKDTSLSEDPVLTRWSEESKPMPQPWPKIGDRLPVKRTPGDPAWAKQLIKLTKEYRVYFPGDAYGYDRAFSSQNKYYFDKKSILDPTAGGGSIPFEALRLGHNVLANESNPVATTILYSTLDFPARFGHELVEEIRKWGESLLYYIQEHMSIFFPDGGMLPKEEQSITKKINTSCAELFNRFNKEQVLDYIFARQVTCPHCGGEAPLLNTCWLSKEEKDLWGVRIISDGTQRGGRVRFQTYRVAGGKGPNGEDPNQATVTDGEGTCVHCKRPVPGDEIKAQARGESPHGRWKDRLYCVVALRLEPKLDKEGKPVRYKSGDKKGEIQTRKVRFFRPPNEQDLNALEEAEKRLKERWPEWEAKGLIPTENFPNGNDMRPVTYGMPRWCDMFTPRQLLGHLYLVEGLNRIKPEIIRELGPDRGRAVVTYLQFAIDKGLDYNSRQTRWEYTRGIVKGTFSRHDFSLKWTFGEMIFTGPNSGAAWGLSQVADAYRGIAKLAEPLRDRISTGEDLPLTILHGTAAHMPEVPDKSVDLVCMDPPYYNNVQYAELSDYFYVWQRRTLADLYPGVFTRRLVNKTDEAVANPARDGSARNAKETYERMMREIFAECNRALKDNGLLTLMFTHKDQSAWEALTRSLIEAGWTITASFPVESEAAESLHQKDLAAAASSIFLTCRKREANQSLPAAWTGIGGQGVQHKIRAAVEQGLKEFAPLNLNPVDQMVACYGRALHVLSEQWPVMDGDEPVGPIRAMNEASRVVAEQQITRITNGRLCVDDLDPETSMALTLYGIWGLNSFSFDEALNLSRSLNIALAAKGAGYRVEDRMIGINKEEAGKQKRGHVDSPEETGYHAPLLRKGSRLRLARPEERNPRRLDNPQADWDILHGLILGYRRGDIPVARAYLDKHAQRDKNRIMHILDVWAKEMDDPNLRREAETLRFGLK